VRLVRILKVAMNGERKLKK